MINPEWNERAVSQTVKLPSRTSMTPLPGPLHCLFSDSMSYWESSFRRKKRKAFPDLEQTDTQPLPCLAHHIRKWSFAIYWQQSSLVAQLVKNLPKMQESWV